MILRSQRLKYILSLPLFIIAVLAVSFAQVQPASAATLTWDGSAGDNKFSTAANWSTNAAPITGDVIQFQNLGEVTTDYYLVNDLSGVVLAGIVVVANSGVTDNFYIDTVHFSDGATVTQTGSGASISVLTDAAGSSYATVVGDGDLTVNAERFRLWGVVTIAGDLTLQNAGSYAFETGSSITGNFTTSANIIDGDLHAPEAIAGTITLQDGTGPINFARPGTWNLANNFVVGTPGPYYPFQIVFSSASSCTLDYSCSPSLTATYNLTGAITLNSDVQIYVHDKTTVNLGGTINYNGHTLTQVAGSLGTLLIGGEPTDPTDAGVSGSTDLTSPNTGVANPLLASPLLPVALGVVTASLLIFLAVRRRAN